MTKQPGGAALRRSARINVNLPVTISGALPDGKRFSEEALILTVSKFGAKLKSQQALKLGMEIKVQPRQRRDAALFRVVWEGRPDTPREGEVGIEYVQVSNLLGVAFPE